MNISAHRGVVGALIGVLVSCAFVALTANTSPQAPTLSPTPQGVDANLREDITFTVIVVDPNRDPDRVSQADPEFYEGYGILFEHDARGEGPICVDRATVQILDSTFEQKDLDVLPERRCITLDTLRAFIWEDKK